MIRVHEDRPEPLVIVGDLAIAMVLLTALIAVNLLR